MKPRTNKSTKVNYEESSRKRVPTKRPDLAPKTDLSLIPVDLVSSVKALGVMSTLTADIETYFNEMMFSGAISPQQLRKVLVALRGYTVQNLLKFAATVEKRGQKLSRYASKNDPSASAINKLIVDLNVKPGGKEGLGKPGYTVGKILNCFPEFACAIASHRGNAKFQEQEFEGLLPHAYQHTAGFAILPLHKIWSLKDDSKISDYKEKAFQLFLYYQSWFVECRRNAAKNTEKDDKGRVYATPSQRREMRLKNMDYMEIQFNNPWPEDATNALWNMYSPNIGFIELLDEITDEFDYIECKPDPCAGMSFAKQVGYSNKSIAERNRNKEKGRGHKEEREERRGNKNGKNESIGQRKNFDYDDASDSQESGDESDSEGSQNVSSKYFSQYETDSSGGQQGNKQVARGRDNNRDDQDSRTDARETSKQTSEGQNSSNKKEKQKDKSKYFTANSKLSFKNAKSAIAELSRMIKIAHDLIETDKATISEMKSDNPGRESLAKKIDKMSSDLIGLSADLQVAKARSSDKKE